MDILGRFNLNDVVSFQLRPGADATYPDSFKRCMVTVKTTYDNVRFFNEDPEVLHQRVYPSLPAGTCPNDPKKYNWLVVEMNNNTTCVIGEPWINEATIVLDTAKRGWTFYCSDGPENGGVKGRQALLGAGFTVNSVTPD